MTRSKRRASEEFSLSFLDVICCGFGAIVLLLIVTSTVQRTVLEETHIDLDGQVAARRDAAFQLRGETRELTRQVADGQAQLDGDLRELAKSRRELSEILGQFAATQEQAETQAVARSELAAARQSLTEEMTRLLGVGFERQDNVIGGITADSEYIIFVIDTSGSMQRFAWGAVVRKLGETLQIYPEVKGIQVLNDMGDYMFSSYRDRWIADSPGRRESIMRRLETWAPFSNSSPVEGIEKAIATFWSPDKKISIYVFGDDYSGQSIEGVVDTVDRINRAGPDGERRVRIHAVGFPVIFQAAPRQQQSAYRFAALMRELTWRNGGTFVGLGLNELG